MKTIDKTIIQRCPLFNGLDDKKFEFALDFFDYRKSSYSKGTNFINAGEKMKRFGLVLSGIVQIYTLDIDGSQMIMATVLPGETFGESLSFLDKEAQIFACALSDTTVLWLSTEKIKSGNISSEDEKKLLERFISLLATRALSMNDRIQILSKLSIREKLIAFFTECVRKYRSYSFVLPFDRADMAIYLGCDRSALSRELSKMKQEGLISYSKRDFTVNKQNIL